MDIRTHGGWGNLTETYSGRESRFYFLGLIMRRFLTVFALLYTAIYVNYSSAVIIPDFQVNPQDTAFIAQYTTDIAFQPNGNFVVVWEDRGWDHDNRQIYFQRYDSLANPIGSPVLVSDSSTGFYNQGCFLATDSAGNFAICYSSISYSGNATAEDIWVRLYDANGLPLTASIKVDVDRPDQAQNEVEVYSEDHPDIARHKSGKFVVAWAEEIFYSDTIPFPLIKRIYCQFFDADGQRFGNNIWVSEIDTGEAKINNTFADVAITDNGYVLVSWEGLVKKSDGFVYSLPVGSLFSLDGINLRKGFLIISPDDPVWAGAGFIDANATPNNDFVIACKARDILGTYPNGTIVVLRLDTLGNPLNPPQSVVDTLDIGDGFTMPKVNAGSNGYVVIWSDTRIDGDHRNLLAQRCDYNDQLIGKNYRINGPLGSLSSLPDSLFPEGQSNWLLYDIDISLQGRVGFAWCDFRNYSNSEADIYSKIVDFDQVGFYIAGDLNFDGSANLTDLIWLVNYVFKGGPAPDPELWIGDVTADCKVNLADIIYLVNYIFKGGPAPEPGCA